MLALVSLNTNIAYAQELDIQAVPSSISHLYSDVDMRVRLATKPNESACTADQCVENKIFDLQVQQIGETLSAAAYQAYPELHKKVRHFVFSVADKKEAGMASNASGKIVVFRGIQHLNLSNDALTFVIAREMGHVIGGHHEKNTSTKIFFSILAGVLFPAVTLISASNVAAQATTATSVATSAASTATSYFGSEAAISRIKPTQLIESDEIAIRLLDTIHCDMKTVDTVLRLDHVEDNGWVKDLQMSQKYLAKKSEAADVQIYKFGAAPEKDRVREKSTAVTSIQ